MLHNWRRSRQEPAAPRENPRTEYLKAHRRLLEMELSSREIIKRVVEFKSPPRIGYNFSKPQLNDFGYIGGASLISEDAPALGWGCHDELLELVPGFKGEVMRDVWGNIWGRLEHISKGEVIRGAIERDWDEANSYKLPILDTSGREKALAHREAISSKYAMGWLPGMTFAIIRYLRGMENFLMDVLLEPDNVRALSDKVVDLLLRMVDYYGSVGADAVSFGEDWGTQTALLMSPKSWQELFRPYFQLVCDRAHSYGMHVYMHSCGYIYEIMGSLVDVGVDIFQFDQPTLMGLERISREFGGKVAFDCPVDIQKIMPTGDRRMIEDAARDMVRLLGGFNGGLIGKDYPQWDAIDVKEEWADWARQALVEAGVYGGSGR